MIWRCKNFETGPLAVSVSIQSVRSCCTALQESDIFSSARRWLSTPSSSSSSSPSPSEDENSKLAQAKPWPAVSSEIHTKCHRQSVKLCRETNSLQIFRRLTESLGLRVCLRATHCSNSKRQYSEFENEQGITHDRGIKQVDEMTSSPLPTIAMN